MNRSLTGRHAAAVVLFSAAVLTAVGVLLSFTPGVKRPRAVEGVPLLSQDGTEFTDRQTKCAFTPPVGWSMQSRSADSPTNHRTERTLVKFKFLKPGVPSAWLRVTVADPTGPKSPDDLLKTRKPPDVNWKVAKDVESGLTVGGRPAARITYSGPFDPDGKGIKEYVCEMTAVDAGHHVFYFAGTFLATDKESKEKARQAVESAKFDR